MRTVGRRRFLLGAGAAAGSVLVLGSAGCSSDDDGGDGAGGGSKEAGATTTTEPGASPLVEAFYAGVPLVVTMRTMQTFAGLVGVNSLFPTKALADESSRFVVAPNHDTLYVIAVLDVAVAPQVLTLPAIPDRYHVIQILDAWMGGIALLGTRSTGGEAGTFVIAREGAEIELPDGADRLDSPTDHVFVLGRVRATEDDVDEAAAIAASITMAPLVPPDPADRAAPPTLVEPFGPPQEVGRNGAAFYDEIGSLLGTDGPVTPAQRAAFAAVDDVVGPSMFPTADAPDRVPELEAAVEEGMAGLEEAAGSASTVINGWAVNLDLGRADDALSLRDQAVIARYFWGPVPAEEAVYPRAVEASDGEALDGSKRYRIRLAGDDLPPVDAFWSLTVYGEDLYFHPNELGRFALSGDTPGLVSGDDGSIEIVLAADDPGDAAVNWLPVPEGPFTLIMRLYLPQPPILDGTWAYPPIEVIDG
jgi:hypothetical protein